MSDGTRPRGESQEHLHTGEGDSPPAEQLVELAAQALVHQTGGA